MKRWLKSLKLWAYFPLARYFAFWAGIKIRRWHPQVIVITGSSGKTTLLAMVQSQLGEKAVYSHNANSAFGISFHLLGISGIGGSRLKWMSVAALAPFKAFAGKPHASIYVVEADADRPGEGRFLASLLKPLITIWVSSSRSHGMNFERLKENGRFASVEEAIAYEFAHFAKASSKLVLANGDNPIVVKQLDGLGHVELVKLDQAVTAYELSAKGTDVKLKNGQVYRLAQPQPRTIGYQLAFLDRLLAELDIEPDLGMTKMEYPSGRSNLLRGQKGCRIIDSSYNADLGSVESMIDMMIDYPAKVKWLVLGDMTEQGRGETEQHRLLGEYLSRIHHHFQKIILVGPRLQSYALPVIKQSDASIPATSYVLPVEALKDLHRTIQGNETILFKGARFLEGIIERILASPADAKLLARRGKVWDKRRAKWGL